MAELKATTSGEIRARDALLGYLWYEKYEADKEIEFWKKESHDHYERWFNLNKQYEGWFGKVVRCERAERKLRHQKYKRCLAMANLCHWKSAVFIYKKDKNEFYWRWYKRWLKIAEKFKEVMCEYCEKPYKTIVTHASGVSASVCAHRLWLRYYSEKEDRTYLNAEAINYCPMCGNKLNEVNNG